MRKSVYLGLFLVAVGLMGLLFAFRQGAFDGGLGTVPFEQQQSASLEGVSKVKINLGSSDVFIIEGTGEQAMVVASGEVSERLLEKTRLVVKPSQDELLIELEQPKFTIGFNFTSIKLTITLPPREWEKFVLSTGSGTIEGERLQARELKLASGSGGIRLEQVTAEQLEFSLGSGSADITAQAARIVGDTGSGRIVLNGQTFGELKLETGSGGITVTADELNGRTQLETGSGNIAVLLAQRPESLRVKAETGSGKTKLEWEGYTDLEEKGGGLSASYGSGEAELIAKTGSGSITLGRN